MVSKIDIDRTIFDFDTRFVNFQKDLKVELDHKLDVATEVTHLYLFKDRQSLISTLLEQMNGHWEQTTQQLIEIL
jgi:hypothetical protein